MSLCACVSSYNTRARRAHPAQNITFLIGLCTKMWKKLFYEMKGDVHHEKEREQEDAYTKTESHS